MLVFGELVEVEILFGHGESIHARESIRNRVVHARDVLDVSRELRDKGKVSDLAWGVP